MYNLEVEGSHTYYVGEDGILAHNACAIARPNIEGSIESLGVRLKTVEFRSPFDEPVCFVAGTLVHARQGLVPIEQLKVGDFVLSKSDTGEGPKEYKLVTKTFSRESERVLLIEYCISGEMVLRSLVVTPEHPFWVDRVGWTAARDLRAGDDLVIHCDSSADEFAMVFRVQVVCDTGVPDVGWCGGARDSDGWFREEGPTVDLRNGAVNVTQPDDDAYNDDAMALGKPLRRQVFNIEVEDFHTYYVGEAGVWVHNACPSRPPQIEDTVESRGVTMNNPAYRHLPTPPCKAAASLLCKTGPLKATWSQTPTMATAAQNAP